MLPSHALPNWAFGSHDQKRMSKRVGAAQLRVAAMLHLTLPGTIFVYAGEEIGMPEVEIPPGCVCDPFEKLLPGYGLNRDKQRTPMRWTSEPNAGFTAGKPFLPLGPDVASCNVATQSKDPHSILALYRRLIAARRGFEALRFGSFEPRRAPKEVVQFVRRHRTQAVEVLLNCGAEPRSVPLGEKYRVLVATGMERCGESVQGAARLRPHEGLVLETMSGM
jgi:alpha-glucosidase